MVNDKTNNLDSELHYNKYESIRYQHTKEMIIIKKKNLTNELTVIELREIVFEI